MIQRAGPMDDMILAEMGKGDLPIYARKDAEFAYVPYKELKKNVVRYIKYQRLLDQWVFVDLVSEESK